MVYSIVKHYDHMLGHASDMQASELVLYFIFSSCTNEVLSTRGQGGTRGRNWKILNEIFWTFVSFRTNELGLRLGLNATGGQLRDEYFTH